MESGPVETSTCCLRCGSSVEIPMDLALETMTCRHCGTHQPVPDLPSRRETRAKVHVADVNARTADKKTLIEAELARERLELERERLRSEIASSRAERRKEGRRELADWLASAVMTVAFIGMFVPLFGVMLWMYHGEQLAQAWHSITGVQEEATAEAPGPQVSRPSRPITRGR